MIKKVYVVNPVEMLGMPFRVIYRLKNGIRLDNNTKFIQFRNLLSKKAKQAKESKYDREKPAIMIQSSGTTGKPKVIIHSNYSATTAVKKLSYSDLPVQEEKILLDLLPPWIAYAIGNAILYPLTLGCKVILSPTFEPDAIMSYIGEFTVSMAAPFHYRYFRDNYEKVNRKKKRKFNDNAECFISGGDKITVEENKLFENIFRIPVINGYGNNEGWGCLTVNSVEHNHYGSVGIPKYNDIIVTWDTNDKKELSYNQVGEICALTDTVFLKYGNSEENTASVKQMHSDGKVWVHTGDLGYIDEDGFVYLEGRMRRVIVRRGFKISAYTIEDKITEHIAVKECVTIQVRDREEEHVPMAFIVMEEGYQEEGVRTEIENKCKNEMKEYEIPKYFKFVSDLPYTSNGKYDFRRLEEKGEEIVSYLERN